MRWEAQTLTVLSFPPSQRQRSNRVSSLVAVGEDDIAFDMEKIYSSHGSVMMI